MGNFTEPPEIVSQAESSSPDRQEKSVERFDFLREDDRIYKALKFKKRKGFFKHILPASWLITIGFYGLIALMILVIYSVAIPSTTNEALNLINGLLTILVIPVASLIFGIKKRLKYIREKRIWKDCTNSGKRDIKEVFKEFQKLENEYIGI